MNAEINNAIKRLLITENTFNESICGDKYEFPIFKTYAMIKQY